MKTTALFLGALLCIPLVARAAPSPEEKQARQQRMEQRMRTMRTVGLAEILNLDEGGALKLDAQMRPFDDRRAPLRQAMHADGQLLEKAADGDPASLSQVDAALNRTFDNRAKVEQVNREMLETITKGLAPQQKAKVAVFLATFNHGMKGKPGHGGPEGHEGHGE